MNIRGFWNKILTNQNFLTCDLVCLWDCDSDTRLLTTELYPRIYCTIHCLSLCQSTNILLRILYEWNGAIILKNKQIHVLHAAEFSMKMEFYFLVTHSV